MDDMTRRETQGTDDFDTAAVERGKCQPPREILGVGGAEERGRIVSNPVLERDEMGGGLTRASDGGLLIRSN